MDENTTHSENPKHRHETREAVPRYILIFAAGLALAVVAGFLVSWGTLVYFKKHQNYAPPKSAISAGRVLPPPGVPQLQAHPDTDLQDYQIGRASCRKECRSRWAPYHQQEKNM